MTSAFPPGCTFWNFKGTAVLQQPSGDCLCFNQSDAPTVDQLRREGEQMSEAEFIDFCCEPPHDDLSSLTAEERAYADSLDILMGAKHFCDVDGTLAYTTLDGSWKTIDGSFCSSVMIRDDGVPISKSEFVRHAFARRRR